MKRRELLRRTGAGLAATTGVAGVAGARGSATPIDREAAPAVARAVVAENGGLLDDLAADGVIERADLDAFDFETRAEPGARDEGVASTLATVADAETSMLVVSRSVAGGHLSVQVLPEFGHAAAFLRRDDGSLESYGDVRPADDCTYCEYEICNCVDPCSYGCCEYECTCYTKCECGGPLCP